MTWARPLSKVASNGGAKGEVAGEFIELEAGEDVLCGER
jgi:hypothetical protein